MGRIFNTRIASFAKCMERQSFYFGPWRQLYKTVIGLDSGTQMKMERTKIMSKIDLFA